MVSEESWYYSGIFYGNTTLDFCKGYYKFLSLFSFLMHPPILSRHLPSPLYHSGIFMRQDKNGHFPYYHLTVEIKYAREVVYTLISAEFIITVLIDGDTFEYVRALGDPCRLSRIGRERREKTALRPFFFLKLGIYGMP